jgi:hypothetical protein
LLLGMTVVMRSGLRTFNKMALLSMISTQTPIGKHSKHGVRRKIYPRLSEVSVNSRLEPYRVN